MIIKDDKLVQAEADVEPQTETLPPYSPAPATATAARPAAGVLQSSSRSPSSTSFSPSPSSTAIGGASESGAQREDTDTSYPYKPPPRDLVRTGFVRIQRVNRNVGERVVVDPYMAVPPREDEGEEAGAGEGEGRRNVWLETKNGNVDAEVWVVGPGVEGAAAAAGAGGEGRKKRAGIDVRAKNGFVNVKIHTPPSIPPPSFSLRITAKNGGVRVALPRTFAGPLTTHTTNGWLTLSPALSGCTTVFSEVHGTRKAFVGDFAESGYGRGEWFGSALEITCENGRVKLCYLDEENETWSSGLWGRLFNRN